MGHDSGNKVYNNGCYNFVSPFKNKIPKTFLDKIKDKSFEPYAMSNPFEQFQNFNFPISPMNATLFNPKSYSGYGDMDFMTNMALFDSHIKNPNSFEDINEYIGENEPKNTMAALEGKYNPRLSGLLASIAKRNAEKTDTVGMCFKGVREGFEESGFSNGEIRGKSAYMAAGMLRKHKNFTEIQGLTKSDLKSLPAGCVIVWDKSQGHKHGHIAVTLGNGQEASDHVQGLVQRNAKFWVFVPTGINHSA